MNLNMPPICYSLIFQLIVSYTIYVHKGNPLAPGTYSLFWSKCKTVATTKIWTGQDMKKSQHPQSQVLKIIFVAVVFVLLPINAFAVPTIFYQTWNLIRIFMKYQLGFHNSQGITG